MNCYFFWRTPEVKVLCTYVASATSVSEENLGLNKKFLKLRPTSSADEACSASNQSMGSGTHPLRVLEGVKTVTPRLARGGNLRSLKGL